MANLLYHAFAFLALFSYGIYHLISATRACHASSSTSRVAVATADHAARPYYPLALPAHRHHLLHHLPLYLALLSLLATIAAHVLLSTGEARPPALRLAFLESAAALLFFALLSVSIFLLPLPSDVLFLLAALSFALLSASSAHSAAAYQQSELQSKCDATSSLVSAASGAAAFVLAISPRLFIAELALASSIALQGLWSLQSGVSLYVDAFIPEGCHRLLGLRNNSPTSCDLEDSRLRAFALLDLAFTIHSIFISVVAAIVYASITTVHTVGGLVRRHNGGSYEILPRSSSTSALSDMDHIQMKTLSKSTTQA
ncbi:hypothetical protein Cni_G21648 [Canna indica]|uniref:Uncharacterized protein n=1 Tax=Canna indica TaxID=4628 RepID=A0AAQ3KQJ8_9LILI|nr:hypothetical protein Cni_G21648 [Canna indica]